MQKAITISTSVMEFLTALVATVVFSFVFFFFIGAIAMTRKISALFRPAQAGRGSRSFVAKQLPVATVEALERMF